MLYCIFPGFPLPDLLWKKKPAELRWKNPTALRLKNPAMLMWPVEPGLGASPQWPSRLFLEYVHFGQGQEVSQPGAEASQKPKMYLPNYLSRSELVSRRKIAVAKAAAVTQKMDGARSGVVVACRENVSEKRKGGVTWESRKTSPISRCQPSRRGDEDQPGKAAEGRCRAQSEGGVAQSEGGVAQSEGGVVLLEDERHLARDSTGSLFGLLDPRLTEREGGKKVRRKKGKREGKRREGKRRGGKKGAVMTR